jgi:signal transduction histidine kinase
MKSFHQTIRISISLVTLTLFVTLMANWLGYIPDESKTRLGGRVNIAESLAVTCTAAIKNNNLEVIHDAIKQYVERHQQIQSVLLGAMDGKVLAKQGEYPPLTGDMESTPDLIKVPIYMDSKLWGVLQIGFTPFHSDYLWGVVEPSFLRLIVFIAVFGFILYVLLIKKVLSHLDPYKAVPARVKKAFNALAEAVVLINNEERIVLANKVFEAKFHFDTEKRLGEKLSSLSWRFPAEKTEAKPILPWHKTLSDGGDYSNVRLEYQPVKGDKLSLVANCTALTDEKGNNKGVLASFSDVTELERMNQDLENMSRFMRHEIYNELVGASGSVKLLASSAHLTKDEKQLLRLTQKSHGVIQRLLESMREANSIESSFSKEEMKPLRLDSLVAEVANSYSKLYGDNDFVFKSDGQEITVRGQEERIIQMLGKLASNAVDHADRGTPIIMSCAKEKETAVIKILDQGQPLPNDKQSLFHLFASFRGEKTEKENQGIGLYVVKLIAEMYGGSVEARDRKDVSGAEFIVRFPIV